MSDRADALQKLKTTLVDSRNGYEEAVEDADGAGLTTLFQEMVALRTRHIEEINKHLIEMGEPHENDSSIMSTVHRTVISVRAALTGLDTNILPSLISGEERILEDYDETLKLAAATDLKPEFLVNQRQELADKIKAMEVLHSKSA
jgi:uncharacterized protein (TIGR02284 family)